MTGTSAEASSKPQPDAASLRFGDGRIIAVTQSITAPAIIANQNTMITLQVVHGLRLHVLLGCDFVTQRGVVFDCRSNRLMTGSKYNVMQPS